MLWNIFIAENQILREKLRKKRVLLADDQHRRLAIKGKILGRKALAEICGIVTPETILRWHRNLTAQNWDYSKWRKNLGRPSTDKEIVAMLVRMARENPGWGFKAALHKKFGILPAASSIIAAAIH